MEEQIKHQWAQGRWHKAEGMRGVIEKNDICALCKTSRTWLRAKVNNRMETWISRYKRGERVWDGMEQEPECWGDKNPK